MDTHSITGPLGAATERLAALARDLGARGSRLRRSLQPRVREQLLLAAEELGNAGESARRAAAPYAHSLAISTRRQLAGALDGIGSGARQLSRQVRKPNMISRHPYAATALIAGACVIAVRQWRRYRAAHAAAASAPARAKSAARSKSANGAARPKPRRRAAAAKQAAAVH